MIKHAVRNGILAGFFALGTFVMVAYVVFSAIVPADVGKFEDLRLDVKNVKAGSLVFYEAHTCEPSNFQADVFRTISTNTVPPEITLPAGSRFDDRLLCRNAILIPNEAPTGEYRLTITVEYSINAFQTKTMAYTSEPFNVVNDNEEFNILQDAVRNEQERQDGQPETPATPTTGPSSSVQGTSPVATIQPANPSTPATPSNPTVVIPQGRVQQTVNGLVNGASDGVNSITKPLLCNPLLAVSC